MATVAILKGGWGRLAGWAGDFPECVPGGGVSSAEAGTWRKPPLGNPSWGSCWAACDGSSSTAGNQFYFRQALGGQAVRHGFRLEPCGFCLATILGEPPSGLRPTGGSLKTPAASALPKEGWHSAAEVGRLRSVLGSLEVAMVMPAKHNTSAISRLWKSSQKVTNCPQDITSTGCWWDEGGTYETIREAPNLNANERWAGTSWVGTSVLKSDVDRRFLGLVLGRRARTMRKSCDLLRTYRHRTEESDF